jgi:hypothetical protein
MIVIEVHFVADEKEYVSMSADVLGKSKDLDSDNECLEFETRIMPLAYQQIENKYSNVTLNQNANLCVDMMNTLVKQAAAYDYRLKRLGQNEKYPGTYQLEFIKETNARFSGSHKQIPDQI